METNTREKEMEIWAEFIAHFLKSGGKQYKIIDE